ncbi:MAG: sigma-70 family RNA polymerase sigma factor [Chitinivibrionales bacterium]|nr:sigma-70 family RNA polymerase sigma factor [Chitinivibrionales bacterium]
MTNYIVEDDTKFLDQWFKGDAAGFSLLYERYKDRVFGFLLRMTSDRQLAEDIMQDTFVAALRNRAQFDRKRNFLSWIFGIAHKRAIDYFRHVKVESDHVDDTGKSIGSAETLPDDVLAKTRLSQAVQSAVAKLDPLQREVFLLRELGDVPFKEIAELMACPINTALGRMRLALKNIRKELEGQGIYGMH